MTAPLITSGWWWLRRRDCRRWGTPGAQRARTRRWTAMEPAVPRAGRRRGPGGPAASA